MNGTGVHLDFLAVFYTQDVTSELSIEVIEIEACCYLLSGLSSGDQIGSL